MSAEALLIIVLLAAVHETASAGVGKVWDVSASNKMPNPLRIIQWSKTNSPLQVRTITGVGRIERQINEINKRSKRQAGFAEEQRTERVESNMNFHDLISKMDTLDSFTKSPDLVQKPEDDFRVRRESDKKMEKIGGVKGVDRQSAKRSEIPSESWSKQPISIEFRHRTNLDDVSHGAPTEDPVDAFRSRQPPRIDFVTSSRRYYSGEREGRDLAAPRQMYEDYDMHPIFRSYNGRGRDYQIPISRAMYPNRFKADRDYYYRVPVDLRMKVPPGPISSPYFYNRYRVDMEGEDQYLDSYGRPQPTNPTKPKRIIYYATLPEIVRKPIDIRNYPRYNGPYPPLSRVPNVDRNGIRVRPTNVIDPTRRPFNKFSYPVVYKYSSLDSWNNKRPNQYEQISQVPYTEKEDGDHRNQDRVTDNKDGFLGSDNMNDNNKQINLNRMRNDDQRVPWSVPAASEVNIKEDERIPGRKNFDRDEGYDERNRYQNSRDKDVVIDQEMSDT